MDPRRSLSIVRRAEALRSDLALLGRSEAVEALLQRCDDLVSKALAAQDAGQVELLHVLETVVDDLTQATRRLAARCRVE